jgi:hypothetical protein
MAWRPFVTPASGTSPCRGTRERRGELVGGCPQRSEADSLTGCGLEVRKEAGPAAVVECSLVCSAGAECVPAAVLDLHLRPGLFACGEGDLDLGRVGPVLAQVPEVGDAGGWVPGGDVAPFVFFAFGCALVDAPSDSGFDDDLDVGSRADGVGRRPLPAGLSGPKFERSFGRAGNVERDPQRVGHLASVLSATRRKRAAASPQTSCK